MVFGGVEHFEPVLIVVISKHVLEAAKTTTTFHQGPKEQGTSGDYDPYVRSTDWLLTSLCHAKSLGEDMSRDTALT